MTYSPSFSESNQERITERSPSVGLEQFSVGLEQFMAAIRRLESGSYDGNYSAIGRMVRGDRALGAYQIMSRYWDAWAAEAGIPGASWRDAAAQDRVAAHRMQKYFDRYGNWDLVALAWYAGTGSVNTVLRRGFDGIESIRNPQIRQYVSEVKGYLDRLPEQYRKATGRFMEGGRGRLTGEGGWLFPVAGAATWSKGSWGTPSKSSGRTKPHQAIDIYAETGTPIVSPVAGVVTQTKRSNIGGYTARVLGDDGIVYYYAHMDGAAVVGAGQRIVAGQHIGFVGSSGNARGTSPHLHFSMTTKDGRQVNPASWLDAARGVDSAFSGLNVEDAAPMKASMSTPDRLTSMIQQLSDKVAGGKRMSYKEIGMEAEGDEEMSPM